MRPCQYLCAFGQIYTAAMLGSLAASSKLRHLYVP